MAKIRVKVKPGQVLDYYEDGEIKRHEAGDELLMEEKDAEPILGSCISRVAKKKSKPKSKPKPKDDEQPKEEESLSG
jgi:hypothetical protein